jgi:hypothetical protein
MRVEKNRTKGVSPAAVFCSSIRPTGPVRPARQKSVNSPYTVFSHGLSFLFEAVPKLQFLEQLQFS